MEDSQSIMENGEGENTSEKYLPPSSTAEESVNLLMVQEKSGFCEKIKSKSSENLSEEKKLLNSNQANCGDDEEEEQVVHIFHPKPIIIKSSQNNHPSKYIPSSKKDDVISISLNGEKVVTCQQILLEDEQEGWKRFLGIFLALVAALQFSLSALIIKVLGYHPFNLGVWRFGVMSIIPIPFLVHSALIKKQSVFQEVWPIQRTTFFLMVQAILGANSIIFVFFGLKYLNIADSIVIGTSAPVFVTFFAFFFLGERCGLFPVLTALLALLGVGIISKPPIITGAESLSEETMLGVASSFSSMILLTICYVVIRYLRKVHHALVNLCFGLWGLLQSVIMANVLGVFEVPANYQQVGLIFLSAFLAFGAQTCITLALKYEHAGPVALVRTMEVVFAFMWQAVFLGVEPDLFSVIGAVVTLSGVVLTALRKMVMSLPEEHKYRKWFCFLLI